EIDQVKCAVNVDRQRLAQVGVEIGQAGAVDHQVEVGFHALERRGGDPKARLRDVAFDDFDLFAQEGAEIVAVPGMQVFEERRFGDNLLEAAPGRRRTLAAYEQVDLGYLRNLFEDLRQPDFADEPREADEQDVFARERLPHGEPFDLFARLEDYCGSVGRGELTSGGDYRVVEHLSVMREAQIAREPFRRDAPVGFSADDPRQRLSGPNHRREQPACGQAVAEFEAVGYQTLGPKMLGQRPHDVVESLTDQYDAGGARLRFLQFRHAVWLQLRHENVVKILFAEKVQTVATHAAQQGVQRSRGEDAVERVEQRTEHGQQRDPAAPHPSFGEALRVPSEERHRVDRPQVEQTAFDAPESRVGRLRRRRLGRRRQIGLPNGRRCLRPSLVLTFDCAHY